MRSLSESGRSRRQKKVIASVGLTAALLLIGVACTMGPGAKAHASFQACGGYIANPAGFSVTTVHAGEAIPAADNTLYILQLVSGCAHGADVTITPPTIARIVASIRASDGKLVAIEVEYPGLMSPRIHGKLTVKLGNRVIGEQALCDPNSAGCQATSTTQ